MAVINCHPQSGVRFTHRPKPNSTTGRVSWEAGYDHGNGMPKTTNHVSSGESPNLGEGHHRYRYYQHPLSNAHPKNGDIVYQTSGGCSECVSVCVCVCRCVCVGCGKGDRHQATCWTDKRSLGAEINGSQFVTSAASGAGCRVKVLVNGWKTMKSAKRKLTHYVLFGCNLGNSTTWEIVG